MPHPKTVSILLPIALDKALSYSVPDEFEVGIGDLVEVGLGKRGSQIGVVWSLEIDKAVPLDKLKPIRQKLDLPPVAEPLRKLVDKVAEYTLAPRGNVLKMVLCSEDALVPPKQQRVFSVADAKAAAMTAQRKSVIEFLQSQQEPKTQRQIKDALGTNYSVLDKMVKAGMLAESFVEPDEAPHAPLNISAPPFTLSKEQQDVADNLIQKIHDRRYSATLLDGVTGSGKTEVYFQAIREVLSAEKGQVLILLPEIVLTAQLVERVKREFGFEPVLWHSGITPKKRSEHWRMIQQGSARLVIGARSALFLPYRDLKLIVVDEEHDQSFKQEEGVIYQARDMAVLRASLEQIPIVLASATPSLETMVNVEQGKYERVELPARFGGAQLPEVEIVDMRQHKPDASSWVSEPLKKALQETLEAKNQALLFLNRRGYAPLTLCRACGHRVQCPHCSAWLVEHRTPVMRLQCHHCGYQQKPLKECPDCHEEDKLVACGPGVERLREEVQRSFPDANIALITSESVHNVSAIEDVIRRIERREVDIIIGTQMIAKGHHFPHLTLVGIVDADLGLAGGDLRAAERSYQLLHQVAGRAGREQKAGRVFIQSYMPENAVIQAMAHHSRDVFLEQERESRRVMLSPPYSRMAGIILSGKKEGIVKKAGLALVRQMPRHENLMVLGPAPAPMAIIRQNFRYRILLKAPRNFPLQQWVRQVVANANVAPSVRVKVDIDPYHFM